MSRFYVNITGISQEFLDFVGYPVIHEDKDFKYLMNKGQLHVIDKKGTQYLFVDDKNDADLLRGPFLARKKIDAPVDGGGGAV
jgi:hypothetical protein